MTHIWQASYKERFLICYKIWFGSYFPLEQSLEWRQCEQRVFSCLSLWTFSKDHEPQVFTPTHTRRVALTASAYTHCAHRICMVPEADQNSAQLPCLILLTTLEAISVNFSGWAQKLLWTGLCTNRNYTIAMSITCIFSELSRRENTDLFE